MSDGELAEVPEGQSAQESTSLPDVIGETVAAAVTGIPPQAQRNFWKAVGRVFLGGAEWPAKHLEGKARVSAAKANVEVARHDAEAADIKARQKAREIIYRDSAKAAAAQFKERDLAMRALDFHAADIVREQSVREDVLMIAASELKEAPLEHDAPNEIDSDWLAAFLKFCTVRTSEEYKHAFAKILAGEIKNPGQFSMSTVQAFAQLDPDIAEKFYKACNLSTKFGVTVRLISQPFASPGENKLRPFGISYDDLAQLVEVGLVRSEWDEHAEVPDDMLRQGFPFENAGERFWIQRAADVSHEINTSLSLGGPSFTLAGKQLRDIVTMIPSNEYIKLLTGYFKENNVRLYRVIDIRDGRLFGDEINPD
ncbi:DUF2806 domain-containing protein [Methylobacterium sp. C25]|uniref:DUF2806 domain-containing protein n=1 Tax=Methylobacterium sp. C25 TaxID=2721622 RepID=UPI001F317F9C|nr:DUF2806 domain-containing protein [Methylobacterium sp. C25]MCE4225914.1 DUF2806 domain-containing protein [Methylobacterium sp. C25]